MVWFGLIQRKISLIYADAALIEEILENSLYIFALFGWAIRARLLELTNKTQRVTFTGYVYFYERPPINPTLFSDKNLQT